MNTNRLNSPSSGIQIQKLLCWLASFDYDRYLQLPSEHAMVIVRARGVTVLMPSMLAFAFLLTNGSDIFHITGITALPVFLVLVFPFTLFLSDYTLMSRYYVDSTFAPSLIIFRILLIVIFCWLYVVVMGVHVGGFNPVVVNKIYVSFIWFLVLMLHVLFNCAPLILSHIPIPQDFKEGEE